MHVSNICGQAVTILAHLPLIVTSSLTAFVTVGFRCLVCILVSLSRDNEQDGGRSHGTAKGGTCFLRGLPLLIGILTTHVQCVGFGQDSD